MTYESARTVDCYPAVHVIIWLSCACTGHCTPHQRQLLQAPAAAEGEIIAALSSARGRGKDGIDEAQRAKLDAAVQRLEADGGVADPTAREDLLDGRCVRQGQGNVIACLHM